MATLRQYFETDFSHTIRLKMTFKDREGADLDAAYFADFAADTSYLAILVEGQRSLDYFRHLVRSIEFGKSQIVFTGNVILPSARTFHGTMRVYNAPGRFEIEVQHHGEPDWLRLTTIKSTGRFLLYADTQLSPAEIIMLKEEASAKGASLLFRSTLYVAERSKRETPLAFVAHDHRDKDEVARKIATNLQRMMAFVWYDEFSLNVGDNLRDRIEHGLKTCKRCVLVLSSNFFSNRGWTKKEFDSIFTRELLEQTQLVLPVWFNVTKEQVYDYSPSLLNVAGVDWALGEDEVCRRLHSAIVKEEVPPLGRPR
jgi:hypothetical protein